MFWKNEVGATLSTAIKYLVILEMNLMHADSQCRYAQRRWKNSQSNFSAQCMWYEKNKKMRSFHPVSVGTIKNDLIGSCIGIETHIRGLHLMHALSARSQYDQTQVARCEQCNFFDIETRVKIRKQRQLLSIIIIFYLNACINIILYE